MTARIPSTSEVNAARRKKYAEDTEYRERMKERAKQYYDDNQDKCVKYRRQYRKDNPEKVHKADKRAYRKRRGTKKYQDFQRDYQREWQRENREKINRQRRDRYWADPEKAREKARLKAAKNRKKVEEPVVKKAVIKISNSCFTYPYSTEELRAALTVIHGEGEYLKRYVDIQFVYERDEYTCQVCGADVSGNTRRTAAHIVPHHVGLVECGLDPKFLKKPDNLVTTCVGKCNAAAEWNAEFLALLLPILGVEQ